MTEEVETNPIHDLIDAIQKQDFNSAKDSFDSLLGDKMHDAMESEKISVADTIFNGAEEDQPDLDLEDDLDDEDFVEEEESED
jgi:hypothetical protein